MSEPAPLPSHPSQLPDDLTALLRDPRVVLPGELQAFEPRWDGIDPHDPNANAHAGVYIDASGRPIQVRTIT